jgi:hypothetical protein
MPKEKFTVELTEDEVKILRDITHKGGTHSALEIMHANILLNTDDNNPKKRTTREIADQFMISKTTVNNVRKTYANEGLTSALRRKTRITGPMFTKITGDFEAQVIASALSPPPGGRARWTLRLLAEHCVAKNYIVAISYVSIGEMLNTNQVKPHISDYWCIPKENDANFVANMEDILTIYEKTYDPMIPVVCMDEKPIQFLAEVRERISAQPMRIDPDTEIAHPGHSEKIDAEYERCGHGSIFIFTEPLIGWRHAVAMNTRKKEDFALLMKKLFDTRYYNSERVILIADNLNTHTKASFYHAYTPSIAHELSQKFEFHYTPVHGSWLNIAECELSAIARECLGNRRIENVDRLNNELRMWELSRNSRQKGVNWQFTTTEARTKLKRLYPEPVFSTTTC